MWVSSLPKWQQLSARQMYGGLLPKCRSWTLNSFISFSFHWKEEHKMKRIGKIVNQLLAELTLRDLMLCCCFLNKSFVSFPRIKAPHIANIIARVALDQNMSSVLNLCYIYKSEVFWWYKKGINSSFYQKCLWKKKSRLPTLYFRNITGLEVPASWRDSFKKEPFVTTSYFLWVKSSSICTFQMFRSETF